MELLRWWWRNGAERWTSSAWTRSCSDFQRVAGRAVCFRARRPTSVRGRLTFGTDSGLWGNLLHSFGVHGFETPPKPQCFRSVSRRNGAAWILTGQIREGDSGGSTHSRLSIQHGGGKRLSGRRLTRIPTGGGDCQRK